MNLHLRSPNPVLRILLMVWAVVMLSSCDEAPPKSQSADKAKTLDVGFHGDITGPYDGKVSGSGVLVLLADAGYDKKGYLFLADGQGLRPHGVTFILPRGLAPGKHMLKSTSAFEIGSAPSVRVDRDLGNATVSANRNTSGYLTLTAYPGDESKLVGSDVAGSFEFQTDDAKGATVQVTGSFSFTVK